MKRALFLLIILMLFLGACVNNRIKGTPDPAARKEQLRQEMLKWENFDAEGVAQISYMGLSLRKMFVFGKTSDELRFDIIDGGILGVGPSPLISVYLGDYFSLQSDLLPQLNLAAKAALNFKPSMGPLRDINGLVDAFADSIIINNRLNLEGIQLTFSPQLRLQKIYEEESKAEINISYTPKGEPDIITLRMKSAEVELMIDKIDYGKASVAPLPPQENSILDQFLETNPFRDLLPLDEDER